ncbi:MAG TPA: hypothetical protein VHL53_17120, partial [Acidimicrobiia bacterium]|nr:hypothetical protein [Acidimicrobiia bacterium]
AANPPPVGPGHDAWMDQLGAWLRQTTAVATSRQLIYVGTMIGRAVGSAVLTAEEAADLIDATLAETK